MQLEEAQIVLLRPWLVQKSKKATDADPDVLADYIIALLKNKVEGAELVKLLTSQLEDFVEHSEPFAKEVVEALEKESITGGADGARPPSNPKEQKKHDQMVAIELTNIYKPDFTTYLSANPDSRKRNGSGHRDSRPLPMNLPPGVKAPRKDRLSQKTDKQTLLSLVSTEEEKTNKLVIANIPEDKLEEPIIRSYFQRFGGIVKVDVHVGSRIAELEFEDHKAATRAWASPAPIFDNRFIKVFFKKQVSPPGSENSDGAGPEEEPFDVEQFKLQQEEKQKQWEKKQEERAKYNEKLKQMIDLKQKMLENFERELGKLEDQLRENPELELEIKEKYEKIEYDMQTNGVTPIQMAQDRARLEGKAMATSRGGFRGRASSRGRGGIARRGGHAPYSRPPINSGSKKLDFRTKTVLITDFNDIQNEKFQNLLKSVAGGDNVENVIIKGNDVSVTFKERFIAEKFVALNLQLDENARPLAVQWDESARPGIPASIDIASTTDQDGDVNL
jgi:hypothetical protein